MVRVKMRVWFRGSLHVIIHTFIVITIVISSNV